MTCLTYKDVDAVWLSMLRKKGMCDLYTAPSCYRYQEFIVCSMRTALKNRWSSTHYLSGTLDGVAYEGTLTVGIKWRTWKEMK